MNIYILFCGLILAILAVFLYGKSRFKAGYNKAVLEQKQAAEKERQAYEKNFNNAFNSDSGERSEWVRNFTDKEQ